MLRKNIKIYLDTSVISYLQQEDSPEKTKITNMFWEKLKNRNDVEVFMSDITFTELNKCYEPKASYLQQRVKEIDFTYIVKDRDVEELTQQIINLGILTEKSHDDCYHIVLAVLEGCNYIVSWNFKHLVNVTTIKGVRAVTNLRGYSSIDIVSPEMLFRRLKMNNDLNISKDFTVDDIHKVREYNYNLTKDMTEAERDAYYQKEAEEFLSKAGINPKRKNNFLQTA